MKKSHFSFALRALLLMLALTLISFALVACGTDDGECTHQWVDATCTSPKTCSLCSLTVGEPTGEHVYGDWETAEAATCTAKGEDRRYCACGEYEAKERDKTMHETEEHAMKPATCTENGHETYLSCKNCSFNTFKVIPATHDYDEVKSPPSCTQNGYITYTCKSCGHSYVLSENENGEPILPAHGHACGAWIQATPVTSTSDGTEVRNCMNCSYYSETRSTLVLASGSFGPKSGDTVSDSVTYKLYNDGTLKISGSGATLDCGAKGVDQPFFEYRSIIKHLIVCDGVTEVGKYAFSYLSSLEDFELASSVTTLSEGAFSASFKYGMTRITIPESVSNIGGKLLGRADDTGAFFTHITLKRQNITYNASDCAQMFNMGENPTTVTLYSYGTSSTARAIANRCSARYLNLNDMVVGSVGNLDYTFFDGELVLSVINPSADTEIPTTDAPWLGGDKNVQKTDITSVIVGDGIKHIPAYCFAGYSSLSSVYLPSSVISVGTGAFKTDSACTAAFSTNFPEKISFIGDDVFENRTNVTVQAFWNSAADNFSESGVTLKIKRSINILLIGNSLSQDAGDSNKRESSQLYDVLSAMLGEDSSVNVGILTYGARTAGWHATAAEQNRAAYGFHMIGDSTNGVWVYKSGITSAYGLSYMDWDVVTIQPYSVEAVTGVGSMTADTDGSDGNPKDEKFCALSVSLPYLLDHISRYAPDSDVYYYMTWADTTSTHALNLNANNLTRRIAVAKASMAYTGTNSGKAFSGIINAGTAIQNARQTYLAYLNYHLPNIPDSSQPDPVYGIQRDGVHISYYFGRYILALTFAEILIPESKRADGYELPGILDSCEIGELPPEYAEIAQLAVKEAVKSISAEGDAQYMPVNIQGYKTDPATAAKNAVGSMSFNGITASDVTALKAAIADIIMQVAGKSGMKINVSFDEAPSIGSSPKAFTATVEITYGYTTETVSISGSVSLS